MLKRLFPFFLFLCLSLFANAERKYALTNDPIDVVIVSHPKDKETINYCIAGAKKNVKNVGRILVVSPEKLTNKAEWFDERKFPFTLDDVYLAIGRENREKSKEFFSHHNRGPGWYLQQLLKLYSPLIIPDISPNVLIVDADVVFLNPVEFLNEQNGGLFCTSPKEAKPLYIAHAVRLVPDYERVHPEVYSVCHHMLFQRAILEELFNTIEAFHGLPFWKAFCYCVEPNIKKGASEYEIYYNYALRHTDQVALRPLKWMDNGHLELMEKFKKDGYHFVAFHTYLRKKKKLIQQ